VKPVSPSPASPVKGAKAPGFVFSGLAAALAVLLIAALSPSQPPPPPVAEYAPEAVQALKDAPPEQSAENGLTAGSETGNDTAGKEQEQEQALPGASTTTTTEKEKLPPNSERVRRCAPNPDGSLRQTEDPQSPPCVPFWEGDNGGRIGKGVTENEIRFVIPNGTDDAIQDKLIAYFNRRFEFYGRKLAKQGAGCFGGTPADAQSLAIDVAKNDVFGSLAFCDIKGPTSAYYDELARRGVVSVDMQPSNRVEKELADFHPYEWSYLPTFDKGSRHLGELACSLNGGAAEHAGPEYATTPRKWGLFYNTYKNAPSPDLTAIRAAFASCGIEVVEQSVTIAQDGGTGGQGVDQETTTQVQNGLFAMHNADVTSVIALTHTETTKQIYAGLEGQSYQPEVLVSTYLFNDEDLFIGAQPKGQSAHTYGISVWNKPVRVADEFWYQAVQEIAPGFDFPFKPFSYFGARNVYAGMMMLAAGIQMAGPHLTPESFAAGLQRAKWGNPPHRNNPGKVTVSPGTHSYIEDAAIIWWDPTLASDEYGTNGGFCYIDHGKRRRLGGYGKGDPGLFTTACGRYE
jgi:hypothetical protein